jgi:cell division protein FtsL
VLPLAFFVVVVVAVFFVMIFLRIALDKTAFELETVQRQIATEESRQLDLRLQLAELQDPLRIANEATRMGLTYPDQRVAVVVDGLAGGTAEISVPVPEPPALAFNTDSP